MPLLRGSAGFSTKRNNHGIRPLFNELIDQLEGLSWKAVWVPREKNSEADKLANEFYREYCVKYEGRVMPIMRETGAIY